MIARVDEESIYQELGPDSDLYEILGAISNVSGIISTTRRSLENRDICGDEVATLEEATKLLRKIDEAINRIADGHVPAKK
jgi:hypothetical protein